MIREFSHKKYENQIKKKIITFIRIINEKLELNLTKNFFLKSLQFLKDLIESTQCRNHKNKIETFYEDLPIKRTEYLAASIIYYLLNYSENRIEIKITNYANLTKLARQNLRRILKFIANLSETLPEYKLKYSARETYQFDERSYLIHINSDLRSYLKKLNKNQVDLEISDEDIGKILQFVPNVINNSKEIRGKSKMKDFYNTLDKRNRDPKYLAAVVIYIYLRFTKDTYLKQEEFLIS
ncbi:MAG: hypothetical protein ACFFDN_47760 [Candidatus Hodarchaeota archaeon]